MTNTLTTYRCSSVRCCRTSHSVSSQALLQQHLHLSAVSYNLPSHTEIWLPRSKLPASSRQPSVSYILARNPQLANESSNVQTTSRLLLDTQKESFSLHSHRNWVRSRHYKSGKKEKKTGEEATNKKKKGPKQKVLQNSVPQLFFKNYYKDMTRVQRARKESLHTTLWFFAVTNARKESKRRRKRRRGGGSAPGSYLRWEKNKPPCQKQRVAAYEATARLTALLSGLRTKPSRLRLLRSSREFFFFGFSILWYSWSGHHPSIRWFSHIWLHTRCESRKKINNKSIFLAI